MGWMNNLAIDCDPAAVTVCAPENVNELFDLPTAGLGMINRTILLMFLAALIVIALLWFAYRRPRLVPTRYQTAVDSMVGFIRDEVAVGIIGPEGIKYAPYLLSVFLFILVGNLFEIAPFINFPITSRMPLPALLALLTWLIFVIAGVRKQGLKYFGHLLWPPGVPIFLKPLVGIIELVSTLIVRPFSLAVRLLANMIAGHVMLSLLIVSGVVFIQATPDIGARGLFGIAWFILGLAIFVFEILVSVLQAYIFTLLSAVYIQTSIHPEH